MPRVAIEMSSRAEGDALKRALDDPIMRTATIVSGALLDLPTVAQRLTVIKFVLATVAAGNHGAPEELPPLSGLGRLHPGDTGE